MKTKEDFLADQEFVAWVRQPNVQLETYWSRWMAANPEQLGELKKAREFLLRVHYPKLVTPKGAKEEILQKLLHEKEGISKTDKYISSNSSSLGWNRIGQFYRIATILVLSFGLSWFLSPAPRLAKTTLENTNTVWIEKRTQPGEKLQLTLGDGSRVWMNSNSRFSFPERFDSMERRVILEGEAYFEVEKDSLKPFHVETDGLITTVLGTTFNIQNQVEEFIDVSLLKGEVMVAEKGSAKAVWLKPGEALHHHLGSGEQKVEIFDPLLVLAWKEGWIRFDQASLEEVVLTLENWYGVDIRLINTKPKAWKFSGEYQEQTLEQVLHSMAYIKSFEFSINEKVVQLKF